MNFFDDFNLASPFYYGAAHIVAGAKHLKDLPGVKEKVKAVGEMVFGAIESVPIIGMVPAYAERKIKNKTLADRLKQRELNVQDEIRSKSFTLQELYFDTHSSNLPGEKLDLQVSHILDNSTPDRQLISLINDIEGFMSENILSVEDENLLKAKLKMLQEAKENFLLLSTIIVSSSSEEKERLVPELQKLLKERISNMKEGESILIPAGYMNGSIFDLEGLKKGTVKGHAILLEVKKESGKYKVSLFNTGEAALAMHTVGPETDKVYPQYYEGIAEEALVNSSFINELTSFAYNEKDEFVGMADVYACIQDHLGQPRYSYPEKDKPYHLQKGVSNCTKKSLQAWLHDGLKKNEPLYKSFRAFRLRKKVEKVEGILSKEKSSITYTHSFSGRGGKNRLAGFVRGPRINLRLSKESLSKLMDYAKTVLQKREMRP